MARAQANQFGQLIICMLFYIQDAETVAIRAIASMRTETSRAGYRNNPLKRFSDALELCRVHQARDIHVDLTAMAWCIYYNYPYLQTDKYPPEPQSSGTRLRGIVVLPGGEGDVLPEGSFVYAPEGELVTRFFDMERLQLYANAVYLTCVCALPF